METIKARSRVKAARDLMEVVEGLRIVVRLHCCLFIRTLSSSCYIGSHQVAGILPGAVPAHSEQCDYEHAGHADVSSIKV